MAVVKRYVVGDLVRCVKPGDGDGCEGGPAIGERGIIRRIKVDAVDAECGDLEVEWDDAGWWVTPSSHVKRIGEETGVAKDRVGVWKVAESVAGVTERILYDGPPGTGKTFAAQRLGVRPGQAVYNLTCTEEMPAAEIRGHFVPAGDRFVWMDGPGTRAMREGARLVINEIEKASGDVQTLLLAILDDRESCALTLPTGETVVPADGYTVAATMNGDADTDLPDALRSRFPVRLRIEEIHPAAIARLPADLQEAARATGDGKVEVERRLTIRAWLEFARLRPKVGADMAARAIFGARANDVLEAMRMEKAKAGQP